MNRFLVTVCFILLSGISWAQQFQFSQYNFTEQRVNPALVAASNFAQLNFDYRNQSTGGDFNINSTALSGSYPLLTRRGQRWSGVGVSFLDDRSGVGGIFTTQEISLSYAVNIFLSRYQTLTLGARGLYQHQRVNTDGLFTGSQYIPDRGFDGSIGIGEDVEQYRVNYFTGSFGLYWQQVDRWENTVAYWGISFYDFNRPEDSFLDGSSKLHSTLVLMGGLQVFKEGNFSILPEFLYTHNAANNVINVGARWGYEIRSVPNQLAGKLDILTKYVVGRSVILGLQLHRDKYSIGVSYDVPAAKRNVGNEGAFEIGIRFKKLVSARERIKKRTERERAKKEESKKETVKANGVEKDSIQTGKRPVKENVVPKKESLSIQVELKMKQDSVLAEVSVGDVRHEPLVLKKIDLHINFDFNSTALDQESKKYLDDLAVALEENEFLKVKLIGHTDDVGSERFNKQLSLARAEELKDYLVSKGISSTRISAKGMGEEQPVATNETEEGRTRNRRVELTVLYDF